MFIIAKRRSKLVSLVAVSALAILIGTMVPMHHPVSAQCPTTLTVDITDHPWLLVDSNKPGVEGPQVTTTLAQITNTGGTTAENVWVYVGDGITPGQFNAGSDGNSLGMLGDFIDDASRYIANLEPGQTKTVFWQLTFPFTDAQTYPMTVWTENEDGCVASDTHIYTTQKTISASADKILGEVVTSPLDATVGVGNIVTITVRKSLTTNKKTWDFGIVDDGLNGDESGWMQPVGNIDFDPTLFRLIRTEVYISSIANVAPYGTMPYYDQLYYGGIGTHNPEPNYRYDAADYYTYTFIALAPGTTEANLYMEASSGQQEKYSPDIDDPDARIRLTAVEGNIVLVKGVTPEEAYANDTLTYTINYSNTGSLPVGDPESGNGLVVIDESINEYTTYISGSATCSGNCSVSYSIDDGVTWTFTEPAPELVTKIKWYIEDQIPAYGSGYVGFQAIVDADFPGDLLICNESSANIGGTDTVLCSTVCANGDPVDLSLTKSVDNTSPCVGDTVTFTINVTNSGPIDAHNIVVTDVVPSGYSYVAGSITGGDSTNDGDPAGTGLMWTIDTLANGNTISNLTFDAVVNASGNYVNPAEITAVDEPDPDSTPNDGIGDDYDTATTIPNPLPICTITPDALSVCQLTTGHVASVPDAGLGATYTWTLTGDYTNLTGQGTSSIAWDATDYSTGNVSIQIDIIDASGCTCSSNIDIAVDICEELLDLELNKEVDNSTPEVGETVTFTINVTNKGVNNASGVVVEDILPGCVTYVSDIPSQGNYDSASGNWTIGDIDVSQYVTLSIIADVTTTGLCTNIAQILACDQTDIDSIPGNNIPTEDDQDDATINVWEGVALDPADKDDTLLIDADGNGYVSSGDTIRYEIIIWNEGNIDATDVVFTDEPDPNTTLVAGSVTTSQGIVYLGNDLGPPADTLVEIFIGTLPAGGPASGTATISFLVTVNEQLPPGLGYIYNQGVFTSNEAPPRYTNDPQTDPDGDPTGTPLGQGPSVVGVPVFPNLYIGIVAALMAGLLAYSLHRRIRHWK